MRQSGELDCNAVTTKASADAEQHGAGAGTAFQSCPALAKGAGLLELG